MGLAPARRSATWLGQDGGRQYRLNQLRVYMEIAGEIVKHAAPWVKTAKAELQATGCAGGSSYCTRRSARIRLRDQIESEDSRSCGSTVLSAVAARALAGNCSTVARWPSHKRVTSTTCPSGNSSAS
jgi:hypothetical protein